jgi:hypothetical protein
VSTVKCPNCQTELRDARPLNVPTIPFEAGGDKHTLERCNESLQQQLRKAHEIVAWTAECLKADDVVGSEYRTLVDEIIAAQRAAKAEAYSRADRLTEAFGKLRSAMGHGQPWSVPATLRRLAEAAEHLLDAHGCDAHGYEEVSGSVQRARDYATDIEILLAAEGVWMPQ